MGYEQAIGIKDLLGSLLLFFIMLYAVRTENMTRYYVLIATIILWFNPFLFDNPILVLSNIFLHIIYIPLFLLSQLVYSLTEKEDRIMSFPILLLLWIVLSQSTWLYEYNFILRGILIFVTLLLMFLKVRIDKNKK